MINALLLSAALVGHLSPAWWAEDSSAVSPDTNLTSSLMFYLELEEYDGVTKTNSVDQTVNNFAGVNNVRREGKTLNYATELSEGYRIAATNALFGVSVGYTNFSFNLWYSTPPALTISNFLGGIWANGNYDGMRTWGLYVGQDDVLRLIWLSLESEVLTASNSVPINVGNSWNMLTAVYNNNNNTINLYVNGVAEETASVAFHVPEDTAVFSIGDSMSDDFFVSEFTIDSAAFWTNRVLSASEVLYLYNSGSGLAYPFSAP